mgnify:FL=1
MVLVVIAGFNVVDVIKEAKPTSIISKGKLDEKKLNKEQKKLAVDAPKKKPEKKKIAKIPKKKRKKRSY